MTNCRHFGERPNRDEIAGMEDQAVIWSSAVGDTIRMNDFQNDTHHLTSVCNNIHINNVRYLSES